MHIKIFHANGETQSGLIERILGFEKQIAKWTGVTSQHNPISLEIEKCCHCHKCPLLPDCSKQSGEGLFSPCLRPGDDN
ncbi:CLUMA_CG021166, isoform A [Clunio marinus]|uniref:CLUMA_CG021166, isoform A n=1 Tax=Clunio marinus TaxID=568069 RepID=A0A1J1J7Z2_9DIPT|nr:CLUMA_CG021166, isoform A [Clunio marinus]